MPLKTKKILTSVLPLVSVLILFLIVGRFGIGKIRVVRDQISKAQKDEKTLTQNLKILSTVSETINGDKTSLVTLALPSTNPSLLAISQLKNLAITNGLLITTIKAGNEVKDNSGLSRVDIAFEMRGDKRAIYSFLGGIGKLAPIMLISKVKITESTGNTGANVTIASFWEALPKDLPATTELITDFTQKDKELLNNILSLTPPTISGASDLPASQESGRVDPFGP